jgi:hypothetical protein
MVDPPKVLGTDQLTVADCEAVVTAPIVTTPGAANCVTAPEAADAAEVYPPALVAVTVKR